MLRRRRRDAAGRPGPPQLLVGASRTPRRAPRPGARRAPRRRRPPRRPGRRRCRTRLRSSRISGARRSWCRGYLAHGPAQGRGAVSASVSAGRPCSSRWRHAAAATTRHQSPGSPSPSTSSRPSSHPGPPAAQHGLVGVRRRGRRAARAARRGPARGTSAAPRAARRPARPARSRRSAPAGSRSRRCGRPRCRCPAGRPPSAGARRPPGGRSRRAAVAAACPPRPGSTSAKRPDRLDQHAVPRRHAVVGRDGQVGVAGHPRQPVADPHGGPHDVAPAARPGRSR